MKQELNIVWLKRDLRLEDNEALHQAIQANKRFLICYFFEPTILQDPHYSQRHFDFIKQSLQDINNQLIPYQSKVLVIENELIPAFKKLQDFFQIDSVYSHQETGLLITYERDKEFNRFARNNLINWKENVNNGVFRGLENRELWFERWTDYMNKPQLNFKPKVGQLLRIEEIEQLESLFKVPALETAKSPNFQKGGMSTAQKYANSFFEQRHELYMKHISKPADSRKSCSRLSPYLAWGNLSVRQVFQQGQKTKRTLKNKRHIAAFLSRLRWQAHFIQKFEMEYTMEQASVNKGYHKLKKSISTAYQKAWREGLTGFPLVDASMRCLNTTGYLNFRMRALLVSFFTHILWQPWQAATQHLSQQFLDFEPGIHFPQLQMQAGETGINNLRIYNPIKNALEHDPEARFIKTWVPELAQLDLNFIQEPYLMTPLEQQFYNFRLGRDYPYPIVDHKEARSKASEILWGLKKDPVVLRESQRILAKHTLKDRKRMLRDDS